MKVINARNVNDAVVKGITLLGESGQFKNSRVGKTIEYPEAVCTVYANPLERVLFNPVRDANPFFHLMEALWMLAGRRDVAWIERFNKRMREYSDDGEIFHGAYGYRWRHWFNLQPSYDHDQLDVIIGMLKRDPDTRRAVLQIWDAEKDLGSQSKDVPCNTQVMFKIRAAHLDMLVTNRSNDIIWGAYGANAVHFSILQEYVAGKIGAFVGRYTQVSDSYHVYEELWPKAKGMLWKEYCDPYSDFDGITGSAHVDLIENAGSFDEELALWFDNLADDISFEQWEDGLDKWENPYFIRVATPMYLAWIAYKKKDRETARKWAGLCEARDWRQAALEWIERRKSA